MEFQGRRSHQDLLESQHLDEFQPNLNGNDPGIQNEVLENNSEHKNIVDISGNEHEQNHLPQRKRYHRHTHQQIERMKAVFEKNPNPGEMRRNVLSEEIGLEPQQVKFWFQNRRNQMKMQNERQHNQQLKEENEKLCAENAWLKEILSSATCLNCGGPSSLGEITFDEDQNKD